MATRSRVGRFEIVRKLGAGATAKVKHAVDTATGGQVALKIMKGGVGTVPTRYLAQAKTEIEALNRINHPNVLRIFEVNENATYVSKKGSTFPVVYIAMELVTNGELFDVLYYTGRFEEPIARVYFKQLVEAIASCHANGIAHRDLKPENVLFDHLFTLKLVDFGYAGPTAGRDGSGQLHTFLGTETYMAPEIHRRSNYTGEAVDMFALGVILFIMVSQHPAFGKAMENDRYYSTFVRDNARFWMMHGKTKPAGFYSESFVDLVNRLLAYNPQDRPTASQVLQHSWLSGPSVTLPEAQATIAQRHAIAVEKKRVEAQRRTVTGTGAGRYRDDLGSSGILSTADRRLSVFVDSTHKYSRLFTSMPADAALAFLNGFFAEKKASVQLSDAKFKARYELFAEDELFTEDGEKVAIDAEILDAGEGRLCIDLTKKEGATHYFLKCFQELEQALAEE